MKGWANSLKKPRFISKLRSINNKGGKKRKLKVNVNKIPFIKRIREKDYSLFYLTIALIMVLVLSILLVPKYGVGGLILPAVLVPTLFFIAGAVKSLVKH